MRYISVCSGIEAASVAWQPLGWEAVAFAEIEAFPNAVLQHHFPTVPNLGDISKVDWRPYAGTVDLVVGGTPCQSFSVAGKREGMDGASGLVREYFRLLSECKPKWFCWENVPGVMSSNGGTDWLHILREWNKCGYHVAFRVLDAQYAGVPQRRRRLFVVGCLGDWKPPAKVLFERYGLQRHPAPRRKAGQKDSRSSAVGAYTAGGYEVNQNGCGFKEECSFTLNTIDRHAVTECYSFDSLASNSMKSPNPDSGCRKVEVAKTLDTSNGDPSKNQGGIAVCYPINTMVAMRHGKNVKDSCFGIGEDRSFTMSCGQDQAMFHQASVRRLTPKECERLQGFPDGWTDITFKGKPAPDGARYKALGNSMAVPCMAWIGKRIQMVEDGEL